MRIFSSIIFSLILVGCIDAQSISNLNAIEKLTFIPKIIQLNWPLIGYPNAIKLKSNKILVSVGFLLQDLKFKSEIDRFTTGAPFDTRKFRPVIFTELNTKISYNYFLTNK